jgi:hypothetical protein
MANPSSFSWKNYCAYSWWKYLLAILVPCLVWPYVFYLRDKPKDNEELQVFIATSKVLDYAPLTSARDGLRQQGIQSLNAYVSPSTGTAYNAALDLQGIDSSDLLIVPSDSTNFSTYVLAGDFVALDDSLWNKLPTGYEAYSDEKGTRFGVKVFKKGDDAYNSFSGFSSWIDWNDATTDIYLFLNAKMPNVGSYNSKSGSHAESVWLWEYLLKYGKNS